MLLQFAYLILAFAFASVSRVAGKLILEKHGVKRIAAKTLKEIQSCRNGWSQVS
jgi:hypothetical protein